MEKLVVVIMGQDCEKFIGMCFESVKSADAIVYCDGGSTDNTLKILKQKNFEFVEIGKENNHNLLIIKNKYDQKDVRMNGKQRNFYLKYLKENYKGWWALCLDADEVVEDLSKIKFFISVLPKQNHDILFSVKMRHFIGNLGHEDATQSIHFVPHRLFKVRDDLVYDEVEHPILWLKDKEKTKNANVQPTVIWHLAYLSGMWDIKKKYKNHLMKSNIHTREFLISWRNAHLFGQYPRKPINPLEIPEIILNNFGIEKEELYWNPRMQIETKHFLMAKQWTSNLPTTAKILDVGCGVGHYGYVLKSYLGLYEYIGIDKSKWIIENTPYKDLDMRYMDITKGIALPDSDYDLVLCIDVLEHLEEKDLDKTLQIMSLLGKKFIFSICYENDPNWPLDPTHKIKESKEWWINKLLKYFEIKDAPRNWLYSNQILIGEKK